MDFLWHLVALISMTLPHALGYNVLFGKGKVFQFGPVGISIVGAYATFLTLDATGSYALAIGAGVAAGLLLSLFFAWLALRLEPDGLGVMSIAVHLAILAIVLNWSSLTRGALGIPRIPRLPFMETLPRFAVTAACIALLWMVCLAILDRSSFGRKLSALAEHEWYAGALGVNRARIHTFAFLIAGLGAVLSSILLPQYLHLLHPNDYRFDALIFLVMVVVAGGPGSLRGVTLATIALVLLKEFLRFVPLPIEVLGPLRLILFGLILFAAVYYRRDTLFPPQRTV